MLVNLNVRITNNNAIYVDYAENGKSLNAAFMTWQDFIIWLSNKVNTDGDLNGR